LYGKQDIDNLETCVPTSGGSAKEESLSPQPLREAADGSILGSGIEGQGRTVFSSMAGIEQQEACTEETQDKLSAVIGTSGDGAIASQESPLALTVAATRRSPKSDEQTLSTELAAAGKNGSGEMESAELMAPLDAAAADRSGHGKTEAAEQAQVLESAVRNVLEARAASEQTRAAELAAAALCTDLQSDFSQPASGAAAALEDVDPEASEPEAIGLQRTPEALGEVDIGLELRLLSMHASYGLIGSAQQSVGAAQR
jgi:hypothetical protein